MFIGSLAWGCGPENTRAGDLPESLLVSPDGLRRRNLPRVLITVPLALADRQEKAAIIHLRCLTCTNGSQQVAVKEQFPKSVVVAATNLGVIASSERKVRKRLPALQDHRLAEPKALHCAGHQRGLRKMGGLSARWPRRHGFPRSHRGRRHHPQDPRQVLSCPPPQRRRRSSMRIKGSRLPGPLERTYGHNFNWPPQSVTTLPVHFLPPKWTTFSPPPRLGCAAP